MRLRTSRPSVPAAALLGPAALALCAGFAPTPAHAARPAPDCVASGIHDFPVRSRIHGGPDDYRPGGGFGTWYLDLTNTTAHACGAIHPVVVLTDTARTLRPEQLRMEFVAGGRTHPVRFERSDEAENVAPFDDGFPGFTLEPGRTLTVTVRLALASAATAPNDVVVNAAVVQRHGDDGDWVGESDDYRFHVGDDGPGTGREETPDEDGTPEPAATAGAGTAAASPGPGTASPGASADADTALPSLEELARTGGAVSNRPVLAALAVALTVVGTGLLVLARRSRARRR
ncbi:hypothetical protein ACGFS9_07070 [Streptomyces sp. NPDC048566]|uniref:hypothetical protein n=1 Tax=Streptomyces sp. NPDC048566 TaxID=3365569 RepID=UPI00371ED4E9